MLVNYAYVKYDDDDDDEDDLKQLLTINQVFLSSAWLWW